VKGGREGGKEREEGRICILPLPQRKIKSKKGSKLEEEEE